MSVHRFFAPAIRPGDAAVELSGDEARHLISVLRLRAGDDVRAFDGAGGEWDARVASIAGRVARLDLTRAIDPVAEPAVPVTLGVGLLKGAQMDAVVRDATALGVRAIVPLETDHVAVPSAARRAAAAGRWHRVAIAAAKQCGRAVVPDVAGVAAFDRVLDRAVEEGDRILMAVEPGAHGGGAPIPEAPPRGGVLALVGPEGGWTAAETSRAVARGATLVHLGPRTLRAELAPAVLLSAIRSRWGW